MPYNILLLPLLGGFLFVNLCDSTKWHIQRAEKDRLLMYSALAGLASLALAYLVRSIPPLIPCVAWLPCPPTWWDANIGFKHSGLATLAFSLGALGWWPVNLISDWFYKDLVHQEKEETKRRELGRAIAKHGNPLEQLLFRSMQERKLLMLTLKGGKVYIGKVGKSFVPGRNTIIHLLPSKSGYRDNYQRVVLTTDYDAALLALQKRESAFDEISTPFVVIIPVSEVVTASLYLADVHEKYFPPRVKLVDAA